MNDDKQVKQVEETGIFSKAYLGIETFFTKAAGWIRGKRSVKKAELEVIVAEIAKKIRDSEQGVDKKISSSQTYIARVVERHYQQLMAEQERMYGNHEKTQDETLKRLTAAEKKANDARIRAVNAENLVNEIRKDPWVLFGVGSFKDVSESIMGKFKAKYQQELEVRIEKAVTEAIQNIDEIVHTQIHDNTSGIVEDFLAEVNSYIRAEAEQVVRIAIQKEIEEKYKQGILRKPMSRTKKVLIGVGVLAVIFGAMYVSYAYAKGNLDYKPCYNDNKMIEIQE